jgi:hypothetical protein
MTILPSIATSLRKKYNKWLFMSRRPNQNRPVPNSSTVHGGGKRRTHHNSMRAGKVSYSHLLGHTPSVPSLTMWRGTKERGTHDAKRKRKPIQLAVHRGTHWAGTPKTLSAHRRAAGVARSIHRGASAGKSDAPKSGTVAQRRA